MKGKYDPHGRTMVSAQRFRPSSESTMRVLYRAAASTAMRCCGAKMATMDESDG